MAETIALRDLHGFIFDMDGVIYWGNSVVAGAPEFVANLRRAGVPFIFLTNNATTPSPQVAQRLARMGIAAKPHEIITTAGATADAVAAAAPGARVLLVGEEGIRLELLARGFKLVSDHREADVVVAGLDRQLTYDKLKEATLAIRRGAPFFATNTDRTLPTEIGWVPGAGVVVGALEIATDVKARETGKPNPAFFLYGLKHLGTLLSQTAAIGDRPETDIVGGQLAGLHTIAVLTGAGTAEAFAAMQPPPTWVFPDLVALNQAYFGGTGSAA